VAVPLRSVVDYSDNYTTLETRGSDNGSWALERAQVSDDIQHCDTLQHTPQHPVDIGSWALECAHVSEIQTAMHCNVLQCTATRCSTHCNIQWKMGRGRWSACMLVQHAVLRALQHSSIQCNTLQHTLLCTLQHTLQRTLQHTLQQRAARVWLTPLRNQDVSI